MVIEMTATRRPKSLDGAMRRRLYLFRHGSVDYIDANGNWVPDPDVVALNARGRAQAKAMAELFAGITVDRAVCSGLLRTYQTGEVILGDRQIELEVASGLEEIRPAKEEVTDGYDVFSDIAYSHWRAPEPGATFLGGENYDAFYDRVSLAMEELLADENWHDLAVFAHGGTNAAVLGWVTGTGLSAFGLLDQETCCLNIIDFDVSPESGLVIRKTLRAMNVTADDPVKSGRHAGDMEMLAGLMLRKPQR